MDIFVLVLFLAGQKIEPPGNYMSKEECIKVGESAVASFKKEHKHASAWFWCVPGQET
jgi:hypothetical protein